MWRIFFYIHFFGKASHLKFHITPKDGLFLIILFYSFNDKRKGVRKEGGGKESRGRGEERKELLLVTRAPKDQ